MLEVWSSDGGSGFLGGFYKFGQCLCNNDLEDFVNRLEKSHELTVECERIFTR